MARLKSKEFKKKYVSTMDNIPQQGVWSGRGIAIPAAGAIGGGDDYKQKIGRGKLPDFRTGSPTQGADSTFSSYLARVNKGYDGVYLDNLMFPEQEEEDEDIYSYDNTPPVRSRKLPKDFRIMRPRLRGLKEMMKFNDDTMVTHTQYSVVDVFENHQLYDINEEISMWTPVEAGVKGVGLIGKGIASFIKTAAQTGGKAAKAAGMAIPGIDVAILSILLPLKLYRLSSTFDDFADHLGVSSEELGNAIVSSDGSKIERILDRINHMSTDEQRTARRLFERMIGIFKSMVIDLIMSLDSIVALIGLAADGVGVFVSEPLFNLVTSIGGFFADAIPWERWLMRIDASIAMSLEKIFTMLTGPAAGSYVNKLIISMQTEGGPLAVALFADPAATFLRLQLLYLALSGRGQVEGADEAEIEDQPEAQQDSEQEITVSPEEISREEIQDQSGLGGAISADINLLRRELGLGGSQGVTLEGSKFKGKEFMKKNSKNMSIDQLRNFIRESIYPDYESYHPPLPLGYEYRAVPTVVSKDEVDEEFSTLDNYDDFAVAYKTDGGIVAYQDRNKLVKEHALRSLVRKGIRSIIEADKKKDFK